MRSTAIAMGVAGVFAAQAASLAEPQSYQVSVAAIETESAKPDVNGETRADAGSPPPEVSTTGNPLWAIPISKLSATRDRPLFSASRRPRTPAVAAAPVAPPVAAAKPVALELPPFTLIGTIISENSRIAIFLDETSKIATGVREGERTSGWTLRSVESRSAVLEGSNRMVTLDLPEPAADGTSLADGSSAGEDNSAPRILGAPRKRKFLPDNPN
jgi:general secretion pathway protein N